jgi:hypothetical protein
MPTKKTSKKKQNKQKLKEKILSLYIKGNTQQSIYDQLKEHKLGKDLSRKKLKALIKENYFLSPKNFRLGAWLLFILTLVTPPITVYIRGFEYRSIFNEIAITSIIFAIPFAAIAISLHFMKDLKKIYYLAGGMLVYLVIYVIIFLLISSDIKIWTLALFPMILLPTFIEEFFKLKKLIVSIESSRQ